MKKILFYAALVAMTFTSCAKKNTYTFAGKTLNLIELPGVAYQSDAVTRAVTLKFDADNSFSGASGCNLINGSFYVNADTLRFPQPIAMTRMMCDDASNAVEQAMTQLVNNANRYVVDGEQVSIYNGETLLGVFAISSTPDNTDGQAANHECKHNGEHKCKQQCKSENSEHKCQNGQQAQAPAQEAAPEEAQQSAKPVISDKPVKAGTQNLSNQANTINAAAAAPAQATAAKPGAKLSKQPVMQNSADLQNADKPLQKAPTKVSNIKVVKKTDGQ